MNDPEVKSAPPARSGFWWKLRERYRWMSLRNKIGLWGLLVFIVIAAISARWVQPAYRASRMWFFLNMADQAMVRKDYNSASLALRKAIMSGMEHPHPWKALVRFLDEVGSPEVINVYERLAGMEPTVSDYRFKQIAAALRYGRTYQAEEIFNRIPKEWQEQPEGLQLQAEIAIRKNQTEKAEAALKKLLQMQPANARAKFDLLSLQAASEEPATQEQARNALRAISEQPGDFAPLAARRLISIEQQEGNLYEANRLAGRLADLPSATAQDLLLYAQLEVATNSLSLPVTFKRLREYAQAHPADFPQIMNWLVESRTDADGTNVWVEQLPESFVERPDTASGLFQFYLSTGQWEKVYDLLGNPKSKIQLKPEVLQNARKAIDEDAQHSINAEQTWMTAVYGAENNPTTLRVLSLLASAQGWTAATGKALAALATASPGDSSAWWLLVQHENNVRNLPGLYKALQGLMRINPYDVNVASNWVLAASLVRQGDMDEILEVARRTYGSTYPSDPRAATAYATALLQANQPKEALSVIEAMSVVARREPQRAVYVGSVLAANGQFNEALDYFARSENLGEKTFPEERRLRRIWKGVALGEATSAEEVEKILLRNNDPDVQPEKINAQLRSEIDRRSDPSEVQRIFSTLKAESQSRQSAPPEVQRMINTLRANIETSPSPSPAPAR